MSTDINKASMRLRVINLMEALNRMPDISCEIFNLTEAQNYDIVIFQKKWSMEHQMLAKRLKGRSKLIFDIVDNLFMKKERNELIKMCEICDYVTTGSDPLTDIIRQFNKKAYTIDDGMKNTPLFKTKFDLNNDVVKLVWMGRRGIGDILSIRNVLSRFRNIELMVISGSREKYNKYKNNFGCKSKYIEWNLQTYGIDLIKADICIVPVVIKPLTFCKSSNRICEAMVRALPILATPLTSYRKVILHGVNGFLCDTEAEWYECLYRLINSVELRKKIGRAARHEVLKKHLIQNRAITWLHLFESVNELQ